MTSTALGAAQPWAAASAQPDASAPLTPGNVPSEPTQRQEGWLKSLFGGPEPTPLAFQSASQPLTTGFWRGAAVQSDAFNPQAQITAQVQPLAHALTQVDDARATQLLATGLQSAGFSADQIHKLDQIPGLTPGLKAQIGLGLTAQDGSPNKINAIQAMSVLAVTNQHIPQYSDTELMALMDLKPEEVEAFRNQQVINQNEANKTIQSWFEKITEDQLKAELAALRAAQANQQPNLQGQADRLNQLLREMLQSPGIPMEQLPSWKGLDASTQFEDILGFGFDAATGQYSTSPSKLQTPHNWDSAPKSTAGWGEKVPPNEQPTEVAKKLAQAAEAEANKRGGTTSTGYCYAAVKDAFDAVLGRQEYTDKFLVGGSAHHAADGPDGKVGGDGMGLADPDSGFEEVDGSKGLLPGDVLVFGPKGAKIHGHIEVYLGNNKAASDFVSNPINSGSRYSGVRVFRHRGKPSGTQTA